MAGIGSDLICRVIGNYRFSSEDADYLRYLKFEELLDGSSLSPESSGSMEKLSFNEPSDKELDTELEKSKQKNLRGDQGISTGAARMFRDLIKYELPGGFFTWEDYAKDLSNNFYKMAYAQFKSLVPKLLSQKLKSFNIDRSEGTIEAEPEMMNKVIMDSLVYLHENPDILKDGLVNAFRDKAGEKNRGVGISDAFFVPRVDDNALAERIKEDGADAVDGVKVGDTDVGVLANLKDRGEVKWKWKGIDEYGILHFTLPDLYGSREFT